MKYCAIQDSPELQYAPRLEDWFGRFDVRDIYPLGFLKLPERELFLIRAIRGHHFYGYLFISISSDLPDRS